VKQRRPFLTWVSAAIVAVLVLGAILYSHRPPPKPTPREVPVRELTLRDGRSYWKDQTVPFTGAITEAYPGGISKSRSVLSNGLLDGVSEGWYTNGVLQVREHFVDGVSHGLREKWFDSGVKMSEATIKEGKIEGVFRRWHENGKISEEVEMRGGNPNGTSVAYYPTGSLKARARLEDGKVIEQKFWKDSGAAGVAQISNVR